MFQPSPHYRILMSRVERASRTIDQTDALEIASAAWDSGTRTLAAIARGNEEFTVRHARDAAHLAMELMFHAGDISADQLFHGVECAS